MLRLPCYPLCIVAQTTHGIADNGSQPAPGLPCALFQLGVRRPSKARAKQAARMRGCVRNEDAYDEAAVSPHTPSLRGALATKQSRLPPQRDSGLLRCARNDDVEAVARQ